MSDTGVSGTDGLTRRQLRCLKKLPEHHEIVSTDAPPIVRGPRGEWLRVTLSGRLVPVVQSVKSYLHVNA